MTKTLRGLLVATEGTTPSEREASNVLRNLGATVVSAPPRSRPAHVAFGTTGPAQTRVMMVGDIDRHLAALPDETSDLAAGYCLALGALIAVASGEPVDVLAEGVLAHLLLPEVMSSSYGSDVVPRPSPPISIEGGGMVSGEFTAEDRDTFSLLLASMAGKAGSEDVAAEAQRWRLPVLPFRPLPLGRPTAIAQSKAQWGEISTIWDDLLEHPIRCRPLHGAVIVDLTTMWAGPLATWLLASLGAEVVKIEPECRLDGYRAVDGMGIHPPGAAAKHSGEMSAMFNTLNRNKARQALDLRVHEQRVALRDLLWSADVVIDNLSPRARSQLDISRLVPRGHVPGPIEVSITALPRGKPISKWIAYGSGVHAISGLGASSGSFYAPSVSYPDPLAGLLAGIKTLAALLCRRTQAQPVSPVHVSLLEAVEPLRLSQVGSLITAPHVSHRGRRLLKSPGLSKLGFFHALEDAGGSYEYPDAPFRPECLLAPATPAPGRSTS